MVKMIQFQFETASIFAELSDEDAGRLLKASFAYHEGKDYKLPASLKPHFAWLKASFDKAFQDAKAISEKQRARALKRWNSDVCHRMPAHATASPSDKPKTPNIPVPQLSTPPPANGQYPTDPEKVVAKAMERGYLMSVEEALRFLSDFNNSAWRIEGKPVRTWWKLLDSWKVRQTPAQRAAAIKESQRRVKGLPPVEEAKAEDWEPYTDQQGIRWRRPMGSQSVDDWEKIPGQGGII